MDSFDYLSVLISIVLGLGITQLLSSVARTVEHRDAGSVYWPSMAWFLILLLAHVQTWWSFYGLRTHPQWNVMQFAFVLVQPIGLYLLSVLVLPSESAATKDQKTWYASHRRAFFGLLAAFIVLSILRDFVLSGQAPRAENMVFQLLLLAGAGIAAWTANERYHKALGILSLGAFLLYILLLFFRLDG